MWPLVFLFSLALFVGSVLVDPDGPEREQISAGEESASLEDEVGHVEAEEERVEVMDVPDPDQESTEPALPGLEEFDMCSAVDPNLAESIDIQGPFRSVGNHCLSDGWSLSLHTIIEEDEASASQCAEEAEFYLLNFLDEQPYSYELHGVEGIAEVSPPIGTSVAGWTIRDHCFQLTLHTISNPAAYPGLPTGANQEEITEVIDDIVARTLYFAGG